MTDIIDLIGMAFINDGDEVIIGEITFPAYETAAKIIFICNPNNPTGTIVDKEAVDRFTKQVPDDVVVVFDEAYYDMIMWKTRIILIVYLMF